MRSMNAEHYWTGWALALAFSLGFVLTAYGMAEIWAWLDERKHRR